jgi:hypothetical protein
LGVKCGGTMVRQGWAGKSDRHGAGQNDMDDLTHKLS